MSRPVSTDIDLTRPALYYANREWIVWIPQNTKGWVEGDRYYRDLADAIACLIRFALEDPS